MTWVNGDLCNEKEDVPSSPLRRAAQPILCEQDLVPEVRTLL